MILCCRCNRLDEHFYDVLLEIPSPAITASVSIDRLNALKGSRSSSPTSAGRRSGDARDAICLVPPRPQPFRAASDSSGGLLSISRRVSAPPTRCRRGPDVVCRLDACDASAARSVLRRTRGDRLPRGQRGVLKEGRERKGGSLNLEHSSQSYDGCRQDCSPEPHLLFMGRPRVTW